MTTFLSSAAKALVSLGFHASGLHAVKTLTGAVTSPAIAAAEILGWRFFLGIGASLYFTHPGFRSHIDAAVAALL